MLLLLLCAGVPNQAGAQPWARPLTIDELRWTTGGIATNWVSPSSSTSSGYDNIAFAVNFYNTSSSSTYLWLEAGTTKVSPTLTVSPLQGTT